MKNETPMESVKFKEKVGYATGDFACNLIYATVSSYLLFFYTDIFGISAATAGVMFLVVRIIDAVSDPFIGTIVDRTETKFGKFRPFLLYGAFPFAILAILCFTTPSFSNIGKVIYAYLTYIALSITYTCINVPYGALTSAMTRDTQQVVSITSVRMVFANLGGMVVSFFVPVLSSAIGKSTSPARGWQITMALLGVIGALTLVFCFSNTKERIHVSKSQDKIRFVDLFDLLKRNRPLVILSIFFIIEFGVNSIANAVGIYYVTYNMGRTDLIKWYGLLGTIPAFIFVPFVPTLNKKLGKKLALRLALVTNIIGMMALLFIPTSNIPLIMIFRFIASVGHVIISGFIWSLIPETIEYGEYVTGKRAGGLIYSVIGFSYKFGMALGGIIPGLLLARFGYIAGHVQTQTALTGILITNTIIPGALLALALIIFNFYNLDEKKYKEIINELKGRSA